MHLCIANEKVKNYLENMALINNMCSWPKAISIVSLV